MRVSYVHCMSITLHYITLHNMSIALIMYDHFVHLPIFISNHATDLHFRVFGDDQSVLHNAVESILRLAGSQTHPAGKPKNRRRLRKFIHVENVLLPVRQLLLIYFLRGIF